MTNWDVRCCCELNCPKKNSKNQFLACPVNHYTMAFTIGNDSKLYTRAEKGDFTFLDKIGFTLKEKLDIIGIFQDR